MARCCGMGACQAIEDALVVAACLRQDADIVTALRRYEARRQPRTATITNMSRQVGWLGQLDNPVARAIRTVALKLTPPSIVRNQCRQVMGYDVMKG